MKTVQVNKADLVDKLKANREKHREVFEKALKAYELEVIKQLGERLEDAKNGKRFNTQFSIVEPMDQTKEYDTAIEMMDMSVDDLITLTHQEFKNYVRDEWSWSDQFAFSNTQYLGNLGE